MFIVNTQITNSKTESSAPENFTFNPVQRKNVRMWLRQQLLQDDLITRKLDAIHQDKRKNSKIFQRFSRPTHNKYQKIKVLLKEELKGTMNLTIYCISSVGPPYSDAQFTWCSYLELKQTQIYLNSSHEKSVDINFGSLYEIIILLL